MGVHADWPLFRFRRLCSIDFCYQFVLIKEEIFVFISDELVGQFDSIHNIFYKPIKTIE
jgi:hypothetical protein